MLSLTESLLGKERRGLVNTAKRILYKLHDIPDNVAETVVTPRQKTPDQIQQIINNLTLVDRVAGLNVYQAAGVYEQPEVEGVGVIPYTLLSTSEGEKNLEALVRAVEDSKITTGRVGTSGPLTAYSEQTGSPEINGREVDLASKYASDPIISLYEFMGIHLLSQVGVSTEPLLIATNYHYAAFDVPWPKGAFFDDWEEAITRYGNYVSRKWDGLQGREEDTQLIKDFVTSRQANPWMESFRPHVVQGNLTPLYPESNNVGDLFVLRHAVRQYVY